MRTCIFIHTYIYVYTYIHTRGEKAQHGPAEQVVGLDYIKHQLQPGPGPSRGHDNRCTAFGRGGRPIAPLSPLSGPSMALSISLPPFSLSLSLAFALYTAFGRGGPGQGGRAACPEGPQRMGQGQEGVPGHTFLFERERAR
jgi:hypothetical protein